MQAVPQKGPAPMLRLLEHLESRANRLESADAVRSVGREPTIKLSWQQLRNRSFEIGRVVRERVIPGRAVVLHYPNRPDFIPAFLGVLVADGILFPIAADASAPELVSAIQRSGAGAVIADETSAGMIGELFEETEPLPQLSETALLFHSPKFPARPANLPGPSLLLQSSGTTADPKIVRRDGPSLDAVTSNMIRACGFTESDHVLAVVPLCHSYGLEHGILAPIAAGTCIHVCEKFDLPAVLHELREGDITMMPGVPFMFDTLCHTQGLTFPALRRVYSAGGPLPFSTSEAFYKKFGLRIGQVYGSTEIGSVTFNNPDEPDFDPLCVGKRMDGVSIRILDRDDPHFAKSLPKGTEGIVAIASPSMLTGYVDGEPAHLIDGHLLTGDIGRVNESGSLTFSGRYKLLIDIGGRKVNPLEVEAVLAQHPGIGACVVVPLKLSETVQRLKAVVTRARPDIELSVQDLRKFAQERLSRYKVPRVFEVRDSLPTSPAGKIIRRLVESSN
jgi:acyl-CoA synthetase (AMP-forming)/AMP-acid ligase II